MKTDKTIVIQIGMAAMLVAAPTESFCQAFSSGSDGSYGPINVTSGTLLTLDMPPDGIFRCTTIFVAADGALRFRRNPLNTPVYLLATNGITIQSRGSIDVS